MAKRQQEGDYDERVVAKSKPVRNMVSRSCAVPSTTPSSTVSSSPAIFGSKDHEMRFETRTGRHRSANQQESLIKRDRVTNSQERHQDIRSRATLRSPLTREPSQTEDPTACTCRLAPIVNSWDAGSGLETKEECDILSARSISFKEKVNEGLRIILNRLPGKEMKGIDKNSLIWRIFTTSSLHAAIFLGKEYSENLHSTRNTGQKPSVQKLFGATLTLIREQEL